MTNVDFRYMAHVLRILKTNTDANFSSQSMNMNQLKTVKFMREKGLVELEAYQSEKGARYFLVNKITTKGIKHLSAVV